MGRGDEGGRVRGRSYLRCQKSRKKTEGEYGDMMCSKVRLLMTTSGDDMCGRDEAARKRWAEQGRI